MISRVPVMLKRSQHTPVHLLLDDAPYFLTAAIYQKRPLLAMSALKMQLRDLIHEFFEKYRWTLQHWVILDNHYHLLAQSRNGTDLPQIIRGIHVTSAKAIAQATGCAYPVWWNYWDSCLRSEQAYNIRMNYLLYNPVKHGYVTHLHDYPYSSFHEAFEAFGRERLARQFQQYAEYKTELIEEDDF